jgi:hypothetical protein
MSAKRRIAALLNAACDAADADRLRRERQALRKAWAEEVMAKLDAAQAAVDAAWDARIDAMRAEGIDPDKIEDPPLYPEEEALDALLAEIKAVCDHDRWPREMHWGGI